MAHRASAAELTIEEVLRAGRLLFGAAFHVEAPGWRADLRTTYRRRALETHPDRARALGRAEAELAREFQAVTRAYEVLAAVGPAPLRARVAPPGPARPAAPRARPPAARPEQPRPEQRRPEQRRPANEPLRPETVRARAEPIRPEATPSRGPRVRVGIRPEDLPRRRLLLGEFLYYTGRVPWSALVDAITWQRAERPTLGRIAVALGYLTDRDVDALLARRRAEGAQGVPFGDYAVRAGRLTSFQRLAALGRQAALHRPIGRYFVEHGFIDPEDLDAIRVRLGRHNARF